MEEQHWTLPTITVLLQPQEKEVIMPRAKTVLQLLNKLSLSSGRVLVIRDGELLTPDRRIFADDTIIVRTVISSG